MRYNKIVFGLIGMLLPLLVWGIPARRDSFKIVTNNGSVVWVHMEGDEYYHNMCTSEGNLIEEHDGEYIVTDKNISAIDFRTMRHQNAKYVQDEKRRLMTASQMAAKQLVILVGFSDKQFSKANKSFYDMLNKESGNVNNESGSVKEYFACSSYGKYVPEFDVYGPYTLDNNCKYYGGNSYGGDKNPPQMVVDAVAKLVEAEGENILQSYDADNDGYVDNIFIYYAGHGENAGGGSDCIWPHRSYVYPSYVDGRLSYGGKVLGDYACSCELQGASGTSMSGIGPFCHEFSHVLGLPDLYDTQYSGHRTCSTWDVMDAGNYLNNEHTPPAYSSYERFFMGWLTPTLLTEADNCVLPNVNIGNGKAFMCTSTKWHNMDGEDPSPSEFYLFENRQNIGWDKYLPGHGMLITKVRYSYSSWVYNEVNNNSRDMGVDIIEAGGVKGYVAQSSDPFPGTDHVNSFTPYTGQEITDIRERTNVMFKYMGGRTYFKVRFDGMDLGTASVESLTESAEGTGIILPTISNVETGYEFVGWCESLSVSAPTAGLSGETYYPKNDIVLYAVYSKNGVIVVGNTKCDTETFDGVKTSLTDITNKMDRYTDIKGWTGNVIESAKGKIKVGNNNVSGELWMPIFEESGDMTITIEAYALMQTNMIIEADKGITDTQRIGTESSLLTFRLKNVQENSMLTIKCDANIFYVDSVEVCGAVRHISTADMPANDTKGVILLRNGTLLKVVGLEQGDLIRVVDVAGRVVMETVADSEEFEIEENGFYIIQILNKGIILK